jgi:hypothetical protein
MLAERLQVMVAEMGAQPLLLLAAVVRGATPGTGEQAQPVAVPQDRLVLVAAAAVDQKDLMERVAAAEGSDFLAKAHPVPGGL